jgi:DNA polymerase-4
MQPIILYLDMNSYFATVEQQDNPSWRGQVLGVCEHLGGIIIAASIEAKKWGIKTGTPVWEAKKIYPKIILTHTRAEAYRKYNRLVTKVVSDYTDKVEVSSIDEVVIDITKATNIKISNNKFQISNETSKSQSAQLATNNLQLAAGYVNPWEEAVKIAKEIKLRMKTEVGDYLTCSIGIADNKLLAKIGSDLQKPDGLVVIKDKGLKIKDSVSSDILFVSKDDLYTKLKLTDIPGIGKRMEKSLNALGIRSLLDLKNYPQRLLEVKFGINGRHLYNMGQLNGSWRAKVHQDEEIKSIGHMYTLPKEYRQPKFFVPVLYKLCEMVGRRMRNKKLAGNIIHFYIRDKNYESFGESKKLDCFINDGREIFLQAINIYERLKIKTGETKLIGITVAGLSPALHQQSLFPQEEKHSQVAGALDKINQKYGDFTVCRVPVLAAAKVFRDSVGFGRVKEL